MLGYIDAFESETPSNVSSDDWIWPMQEATVLCSIFSCPFPEDRFLLIQGTEKLPDFMLLKEYGGHGDVYVGEHFVLHVVDTVFQDDHAFNEFGKDIYLGWKGSSREINRRQIGGVYYHANKWNEYQILAITSQRYNRTYSFIWKVDGSAYRYVDGTVCPIKIYHNDNENMFLKMKKKALSDSVRILRIMMKSYRSYVGRFSTGNENTSSDAWLANYLDSSWSTRIIRTGKKAKIIRKTFSDYVRNPERVEMDLYAAIDGVEKQLGESSRQAILNMVDAKNSNDSEERINVNVQNSHEPLPNQKSQTAPKTQPSPSISTPLDTRSNDSHLIFLILGVLLGVFAGGVFIGYKMRKKD